MKSRAKRLLLATLVFPFFAVAGTALGMIAAQVTTPAGPPATQTILSGGWLVDVRTVLAVLGVVLPATWWLSWKFTGFTDMQKVITTRLESGDKRFAVIESNLREIEQKMQEMREQIAGIPCAMGTCPNPNHSQPKPK